MDKNKTTMNPAAWGALLSGDFANAAVAQTPGGIEAQEAAAQQELLVEQKLPKIGTILPEQHQHDETNQSRLETLGFAFGKERDDLFIACTLPEGWKLVPTEHVMWSELRDRHGRVRGRIFYKGAFYDRRAELHMERRFHYREWSAATPEQSEDYTARRTREEWRVQQRCYVVKDHNGSTLYHTAPYTNAEDEREREAHQACFAWLTEHYPLHKDPFAYWEEAQQ